MSLTSLYNKKLQKTKKRKELNTKQEKEDLTLQLERLAVSEEIAKYWQENGCGKPC